MRIGLISPPWVPVPPPAYGGLEQVVDELARGIQASGHEVLLAAPGNSECLVPQVPGMDVVHPSAGITGDTVSELAHVVKAYAAMSDVDVIHDHTIAGPLYRHRVSWPPVITTNHGVFNEVTKPLFRAMSRDTAIVAISHHQASTAEGIPIARVIHHGLNLARVPIGLGQGGFVTFLGRMSPDKGAREAILIAREAGVPLKLAAKMRQEEERDYFDDQIRPLLGDEAEYIGEVDEPGKFELLGQSMALLNPIQWPEPFGLVMIEALACGTPVVATPCGAVPEIVDEGLTGFVDASATRLAERLRHLDQLDRQACRLEAESRFSSERMVEEHLEMYADSLWMRPDNQIRAVGMTRTPPQQP